MKDLVRIQKELKAPKDKFNSFGKYNYRSCEGILEAVKPLLKDCVLLLSDEVKQVGQMNYIAATAKLIEPDGNEITVTAYAREALEKKGMDDAQITGAASSYARKYALNGLFAIDDTQDPDATNDHGKAPENRPQKQTPTAPPSHPIGKDALSAKQFTTALQRIEKGETDVVNKLQEFFTLTSEQLRDLEDTQKFYNKLGK